MTDEQKQQIIVLRRDGAGYGRIAARLQISINTVKSFCRRHSLAAKSARAMAPRSSPERRRGETVRFILCADLPKCDAAAQTGARFAHFASEMKNSPYCTIFSRFFWQYS